MKISTNGSTYDTLQLLDVHCLFVNGVSSNKDCCMGVVANGQRHLIGEVQVL